MGGARGWKRRREALRLCLTRNPLDLPIFLVFAFCVCVHVAQHVRVAGYDLLVLHASLGDRVQLGVREQPSTVAAHNEPVDIDAAFGSHCGRHLVHLFCLLSNSLQGGWGFGNGRRISISQLLPPFALRFHCMFLWSRSLSTSGHCEFRVHGHERSRGRVQGGPILLAIHGFDGI